jgi:SAM-dependent methyltransferase
MTVPERPLSDTWERGDPYENYVGRWSRRAAPKFLAWLGIPAGQRWLDVGCGTGALCAAIVDHCAPSSVIGIEPSEGFLKTARENAGRASIQPGSATAIPLDDGGRRGGLGAGAELHPGSARRAKEMVRVAASGQPSARMSGTAGKMELMRYFWDAAVELDRDAARLDEGTRFPLCRPDALWNL